MGENVEHDTSGTRGGATEPPHLAAASPEFESADAPTAPPQEAKGGGLLGGAPPWLRPAVIYVLLAVVAFNAGGWLLFNLRSLLELLFLAWLFSITIEPIVHWAQRRGIRRGVATGAVLVLLIGSTIAFVVMFGALLAEQIGELLQALPAALDKAIAWVNSTFDTQLRPANELLRVTPDSARELAERFTPGVVGVVTSLVGIVFQGLTLLLFAFYMSAEAPALRRTVSSWFPARQQRVVATVWRISIEKAGGYVVSRIVLAAASAVATGIFLLVIGVPYWLPLAIWTGVVSQFVPTLGTYIAIGLPALIAASVDPRSAVWVVVFGTLYQQVENYVLHPRITSATLSIHPAVAFGSVIAGAALFGPVGALVSVPVVAAILAIIDTYGRRYELVPEVGEGTPRPGRGT